MNALDEKPRLGNRAVNSRGRIHGYDKIKLKNDRCQATFGKFIVNPEKLTKKQIARLTRINDDQSDFAINVQYSLNRKYRWKQLFGAGAAIETDADAFPDDVKVDGCDGAYSLAHDTRIKGHYERNADGNVEPTPNRSFWLADPSHYCIRRNKDKPLDENGKVIPEIRYVQATVAEKRYADFGRKTWDSVAMWKHGRLNRRFELEEWDDGAEDCEDDGGNDTVNIDGDVNREGSDDTDSGSAEKRPNTFTIADFVIDGPHLPTTSTSNMTLGSYDDLADESIDFGADYTSLVDVKGLCKDSFFTEFTCDGSQLGCSNAAFESLESSNFDFQWLNTSKTSCAIDLSGKLHPAEQDVVAVIVIEMLKSKKLRVLLNGSFPIDEENLLKSFGLMKFDSLTDFLETCTTKLCKSYGRSCLSTSRAAYDCQATFHPMELIDVDSINRQEYPKYAEISKVSDIADGFEVIDLENTDTACCDKCESTESPVYQAFKTCTHNFCRDCLQSELTTAIECHTPLCCLKTNCPAPVSDEFLYVLLPLPVINFYFNEQLKKSASNTGKKLIECPHCESMATIDSPPKFNSLACWNCSMCFCLRCKSRPHFPLTCEQFASWATKFELQYYLELSRKSPDSIRTCVCGSIMYQAHEKVHLQTCQDCGTEYYWSWRCKKGDQSVKLVNFADENTPNFISAEYSDVCLPIHKLRFNVKAASELKNYLARVEMDGTHVQFVSNFKLALHLIELGFAWLYLTRVQKTSEWSTLKAHLAQLRSLVDNVMTSVHQALPLMEPYQKVVKLKKFVDASMNLFENV